jgi:hypothetical protein
MPKSPQLTRAATIAATVLSLTATPAIAREADAPPHPGRTVTTLAHTRHWTQPHIDAIGVRPANQPTAASPAPAVPLDRATPAASGPDWLPIAIGSTAMLALLLTVAILPTHRRRHSFRARQV